MAEWRVTVWDLADDVAVGIVKPDSVTVRQAISERDQITVDASSTDPRHVDGLLTPGKRLLIVTRNGVLLSGGMLTTAVDDGNTVKLTAEGLFSQLEARIVHGSSGMTYAAAKVRAKWTNVDGFRIVADVVAHTQARAGGDLGLLVTYGALSGTTRKLDVPRDGTGMVGQIIGDLAEMGTGFEWRETWAWSGQYAARELRLAAPHLGNRLENVRLEAGRNMTYTRTVDATPGEDFATAVLATGDQGRRSLATALNGYPLVERVVKRRWGRVALLAALATGQVTKSNSPPDTLNVEIDADRPAVELYRAGDELPVRVDGGFTRVQDFRRVLDRTISHDADGDKVQASLGPSVLA